MKKRIQSMDISEHPLDDLIRRFADALEGFLASTGKRLTNALWKEYQKRPRGFRRFLGSKQAGVLDDEALWREISENGYSVAFRFINGAAYAGFAAGDEMLLNIGMAVDFEAVNPAIVEMVLRNAFELVRIDGPESFVRSTREQLRRLMARLYMMPEMSQEDFMTALEHLFGRTRAEMIAVTEMTNAYADATIEAGLQAPVALGYEVLTVGDNVVCQICQDAAAGGPYPLDDTDHKPALHSRCRCDINLVPLGP